MKQILLALFVASIGTIGLAQKAAWRQASDTELASLLPARAPVIKEHIETGCAPPAASSTDVDATSPELC